LIVCVFPLFRFSLGSRLSAVERPCRLLGTVLSVDFIMAVVSVPVFCFRLPPRFFLFFLPAGSGFLAAGLQGALGCWLFPVCPLLFGFATPCPEPGAKGFDGPMVSSLATLLSVRRTSRWAIPLLHLASDVLLVLSFFFSLQRLIEASEGKVAVSPSPHLRRFPPPGPPGFARFL